jgi:Beta-lactamase
LERVLGGESAPRQGAQREPTSGLEDWVGDIVEFFEPYRRDPGHRFGLTPHEQLQLVLEKPREFGARRGVGVSRQQLPRAEARRRGDDGDDPARRAEERVLEPLSLERTDLVEGPLRGDCARGYLSADNPLLPGESEPVDVTEIDVPFHGAGGGVVSTPAEIARMLRAQLRGELLPDRLRTEMLHVVESDWQETDRYGLGIGEITALMGRERSACGPAWGHIGFSVGYTAMALSSEDGERQVVMCANGSLSTASTSDAFGTPPAG